MSKLNRKAEYKLSGMEAPWYTGLELTEERREHFRKTSISSSLAKKEALANNEIGYAQPINKPTLDPCKLMPKMKSNGLSCLSLFSGGGGMDLGFDRAGFDHIASYELLEFAGKTIMNNRPKWKVMCGDAGDVTTINWKQYNGKVDVLHGGPPCQPFSTSGKQRGKEDSRDMIPEMVRAILEAKPRAFVMENVPGLLSKKFETYMNNVFYDKLLAEYTIVMFSLNAADFGVPQIRRRCIFIGFRDKRMAESFSKPSAIYDWSRFVSNRSRNKSQTALFLGQSGKKKCMGAREALGLPASGYDNLAPTIRSTLTGPRHTTSILSSTSAQRGWNALGIWANGVQECRENASKFPTKTGDFRLSVEDCTLLQGFPKSWRFEPPVYKALGQVGNSVVPPMAYHIANAVAKALL